jgi:hypothetical protein
VEALRAHFSSDFGTATLSLVERGQTKGNSVECLDKKTNVAGAEASNPSVSDDWVAGFPQAARLFQHVEWGRARAGQRALDIQGAAGVVEPSHGQVRHCLVRDSKLVSITLMN